MLKGLLRMTLIATSCMFINAYAVQLNLTLGDDIQNNQYNLNISYDVYYATGQGMERGVASSSLKGLKYENIYKWLERFNSANASKHPIDNNDGKRSQITFGYTKNDADIYPASCQNILLKEITNIYFTEAGCTIL